MYGEWLAVPVGIDSQRWVTRGDCRVVVFHGGVTDYLRAVEATVLPWHQACRERFDLGMAAESPHAVLRHRAPQLIPDRPVQLQLSV
jgi:hypothetical protein